MAASKTNWVTGDKITAAKLNQLESNAASALDLAQTNEKDIDSIDHLVTAVVDDSSGEPVLKMATDKAVGGLIAPYVITQIPYKSNRQGVAANISKEGFIVVPYSQGKGIPGAVSPDGVTLIASSTGVLTSIAGTTAATKLTPTIPTTFAGKLRVSHLYMDADSTLHESVFDLSNSTAAALEIPANTVFATGLKLAAKEASYSCLVWGSNDELTLKSNATGASLTFTTAVTIPANDTVHILIRDNNG